MVQSAQAATTVSGAITANTTWSLAQSPYQVTADISVTNGSTLTIEAGVVVYFDAATNLTVSSGALSARGTAGQPIIFTSTLDASGSTPAPGDWGQIHFLSGTNNATTILEHAQIRYGQGINVQAASPTFNYLQITNNLGTAISADLNSSPKGVGNQAAGNTLNGISVPAGDVLSSVTWGIKGIPYVVSSGVVSVGASPVITGVSPAEAQQSLPVDVVISGTRLSGAESIVFDTAGVSATLSAGATDTSIPVQITASANQPLGDVPFRVKTAAGWVRYATGISVIPLKPTIAVNSITPGSMRRAETKSFLIGGSSLLGAQVSVQPGIGLTLSNLQTLDTQASFDLTATPTATKGSQTIAVKNSAIANGTGAMLVTINEVLPKIDSTVIPASVLPDSITRTFQLSLSNADTVDHTFNLSVTDPTIITVSPTSVTIPAGATTATINITGLQWGYTNLSITSPTVLSISKQMLSGTIGPMLSGAITVEVPYRYSQSPNGVVSSSVTVEVPYSYAQLPNSVVSPSVTVEVPYSYAQLPNSVVSPSVTVEVPYSYAQLPNSVVSSSVTVEVPYSYAQLPNSVVSPSVTVEVPYSYAQLPNSVVSSSVTVDAPNSLVGPILSSVIVVSVP